MDPMQVAIAAVQDFIRYKEAAEQQQQQQDAALEILRLSLEHDVPAAEVAKRYHEILAVFRGNQEEH